MQSDSARYNETRYDDKTFIPAGCPLVHAIAIGTIASRPCVLYFSSFTLLAYSPSFTLSPLTIQPVILSTMDKDPRRHPPLHVRPHQMTSNHRSTRRQLMQRVVNSMDSWNFPKSKDSGASPRTRHPPRRTFLGGSGRAALTGLSDSLVEITPPHTLTAHLNFTHRVLVIHPCAITQPPFSCCPPCSSKISVPPPA